MHPNLDDLSKGEITSDEESRESNAPPVQIREQLAALPGETDVVRRFNRNTTWLATGLLGSVVFAALVLALQERRPKPWQSKAADPAKEERQTSGEALVSANPGTLSKIAGLNAESPTDEIISRQETSVDQGFTSLQETLSPQPEAAAQSQTPVPALTPEVNQPDSQANASSGSSANGHDSARMIPRKILNIRYNIRHRSVVPSRFVDVKARLIALWHQSLARSQGGRSRTVLSNSNKDANKKADATWKGW